MAAALGSVVVELSANIAKFETGLSKAASVAESQMKSIDKSLGIVKTSLGVLGAGFVLNASFDKIKEKITGAIESAAGLQQLSERTGVAAGALSGLVGVAKLSGTGADELAGGLQKLSKAMIDAENGGKKTSASFAAIGISTDELKGKNPAEVFKKIAANLAEYQDGAEKLVITQNLLGKAGANLLPVLKDLADVGDLQVKVTDAQAKQADEYEKNLKRFGAASEGIYKVIALELVPVLNDFVKLLIKVQTETGGVTDEAKKLAKDGSLRAFFEDGAIFAAQFLDTLSTTRAGISAFITGIKLAKATFGTGENLKFGKKEDFDNNPVYQKQVADRAALQASYDADLKVLATGSDKYEKRLRETFDQRRRIADAAHGREARGAAVRKVIDTSGLGNENAPKGATGPKDDPAQKLLDGKLKAQEDFIASQNKLLGQREQSLQFYSGLEYITLVDELESKKRLIAETLKTNQDAYDEEARLLRERVKTADTEVKRQDARNKLQEVGKRRAEATVDANNRIGQSQQALLAIQRQFDLATIEANRQSKLQNNEAQFQIDILGKSTLEVQKLTAARQNQLAVDERIFQLRKKDPNADVSEAIADAADQQERAGKLIEASFLKQQSGAFGASEALRKYGEDAQNVGSQIESSLTNAFKGAEDAFVKFATTGKISFGDLARSIIADLARMQAKAAVSGFLNFLGNALANSFGPGVAVGNDASGAQFSQSGSDIRGRHASGGAIGTYGNYLVGEKGPEILSMGGTGGTIIPNSELSGGAPSVTINQNIQIDSRSDAATIRDSITRSVAMAKAEIADQIARGARQYTRLA